MAYEDEAFGWDDEVEVVDDSQFELLDEGYALFKVTSFKRGRFKGSEKMAPCYQAELVLTCTDPAGHVSDVNVSLPLNKKMLWKISSFFKSTRLIDPETEGGTNARYPWDKVTGVRGMCRVSHRSWTGDDGKERQGNNVDAFLYGEKGKAAEREFSAVLEGYRATPTERPATRGFGGTF